MSLISQNAKTKSRVKKSKSDSDEPAFMGGSEHVEDGKESELRVTKSKKRRKEEEQLEIEEGREIKRLESFLFGSLYEPVEFGKHEDDGFLAEKENGSAMFFVDRSANNELALYDNELGISETDNDDKQTKELKAVWVDEEEEKTEVNIVSNNRLRKLRKEEDESLISGSEYVARLRAQHAKLNPGTDWARLDYQARDDDFSDDEPPHKQNGIVAAPGYDYAEAFGDILRSNEDLVVKSSTKLFPGILEYSRLVDANAEERSNGPINSVQFHQNGQLLLAAGLDRRIRFFQIDGKRNTKIQSIFIEDCPIRKASFLPDGSQVIISGRRKFFYSFDLVKAKVDKIGPLVGRDERSLENFEISPDSKMIAFTGNDGYILLVSSKTKELIGTLKMNGQGHSLAFADDGRQLLSHGSDGQIYHWDLRTMSCFHKGVDEGCIDGTALCISPTGNFFSAGSVNGIVNVYNREEFLGGKRKPAKVIGNLTTRVDFMKFNHDAQILAICSRMKKDSLKLVHVPSFTVFSNWPPPNRSVQYPHCLDFSHYGGFMAVGNAAGKVLLYKLHHYHHV